MLGIGVCVLLLSATGGHPPGIVFVPVAVIVWLAGHAVLAISRSLVRRGNVASSATDGAGVKWPPAIVVLTFLLGLIFFLGLILIVAQVLFERKSLVYMAIPLACWVPASLCFFGMLLRKRWAQLIAGSGLIVVALILVYEMIRSLTHGYRNSTTEWILATAVAAALIFAGQYILRSARIKAFFTAQ